MIKARSLTRRKMATGAVAATGGFAGLFRLRYSTSYAARFFRERLAETGRRIRSAPTKPTPGSWVQNDITASWLGHATVLINFFGIHILTDPVLFSRVGANLRLGTLGPKRLIASALKARELPPIDLVLLSHAHLDHFDIPSLRMFGGETQVVTASGTSDLLRRTRLTIAGELGWGGKQTVHTRQGSVKVTAFEVNHWGTRWRRDTHRGYNGYFLEREGKRIVFGGDTALCGNFRELKTMGKVHLAIMPIGAYNPWIRSHCNPEEALRMANDAGAQFILPIHHQTFKLGREPLAEPIERLEEALASEPDRLALRGVGETFSLARR